MKMKHGSRLYIEVFLRLESVFLQKFTVYLIKTQSWHEYCYIKDRVLIKISNFEKKELILEEIRIKKKTWHISCNNNKQGSKK